MRVLAVDDDADVREFYRAFLCDEGHEPLLARDGAEALALAEQRPDVIVLDLGLPGLDGYDVLRQLKAGPTTSEIPVVIVTGYPMAKGIDLAGVVGVLRKPYDVPLLALTLERAAKRRGAVTTSANGERSPR
jgi:Amt family ammonium transporter